MDDQLQWHNGERDVALDVNEEWHAYDEDHEGGDDERVCPG